jgi:hypothetical protein
MVITPEPSQISLLEPMSTGTDAMEALTEPWSLDLLETLAGDPQAPRPDSDLETHGSGEALSAGIEAGRAEIRETTETPLGTKPVAVAKPRRRGGAEIVAAEIELDWPANLDLSLDIAKSPPEGSRPRLALPEPKLSGNRAAGGSRMKKE